MNNFNFSILEGNLTDDPSLSDEVLNFSLLSQRDGSKDLVVKITCEGSLALVCNKYLKQGSKVLVSGVLTENGIFAKEVNFLTPRPKEVES